MRELLRFRAIGKFLCRDFTIAACGAVSRSNQAGSRRQAVDRPRVHAIGPLAFVGLYVGLCAFPLGSARCASVTDVLPVPAMTIYPGDAIKDDWLVDRAYPADAPARGGFVSSRETIVGKIARRTLLPGAPIPLNAVAAPKIVANGAKVRVVLEQGALKIEAYGAALQDGAVGDVISLRNLDTGIVLSGTIQADGSVRLSGG